jgi:hypothetical protein
LPDLSIYIDIQTSLNQNIPNFLVLIFNPSSIESTEELEALADESFSMPHENGKLIKSYEISVMSLFECSLLDFKMKIFPM